MERIELFKDYENARIVRVDGFRKTHPDSTVLYEELPNVQAEGIPVAVTRNGRGQLEVTFTPDNHLLAIGATRSGKTTGYVIPTMHVLLSRKNKPNLVISDPKQELYRGYSRKFRQAGYRVILLDFTNYRHSDCWNPLTRYFRMYQQYLQAEEQVELVDTPEGPRNRFQGVIYEDQQELDMDIAQLKDSYFDEVEKGITTLTSTIIPTYNTRDPFWEDSARDLLRAILYGMLEDSGPDGSITEDNFSFDTVLRIFDSFTDSRSNYDGGYFTDRDPVRSKAYRLAKKCIIEQADNTRRCISSSFATRISKFRDTSVRRITCANTFQIDQLDGPEPTVIFVSYKDEEALHYEIISMFLSNLYTGLIGVARQKGSRLDRPFYFLLDEFGNLPKFNDFDKVISACGGRNIWFLLILQSYAQLYNIYGKETAEIIKDNLNIHAFFGTNNPETKREFSEECGKKTIVAPTSALNGKGETIEHYDKETVALVPVSALTHIAPGQCIITQMREDVLWSHMERSYLCREFAEDTCLPEEQPPKLRFSDPRYLYVPPKREKKRKDTIFD